MKILEGKEKEYKDWYDKNDDPYGRACFTYAERWAGMLENLIESSDEDVMTVIEKNADRLSHEAEDIEGITGFMYDCAVSILAQCWKYGKELRKWHNKEYNYDGDKEKGMNKEIKYTSENLFDIKNLRHTIYCQIEECNIQKRILDGKIEALREIVNALDRHIESIEKENMND